MLLLFRCYDVCATITTQLDVNHILVMGSIETLVGVVGKVRLVGRFSVAEWWGNFTIVIDKLLEILWNNHDLWNGWLFFPFPFSHLCLYDCLFVLISIVFMLCLWLTIFIFVCCWYCIVFFKSVLSYCCWVYWFWYYYVEACKYLFTFIDCEKWVCKIKTK